MLINVVTEVTPDLGQMVRKTAMIDDGFSWKVGYLLKCV